MLKYAFTLIGLLICFSSCAQMEQDGPYLVKEGNKVISRSIVNDVVKIDTLNETDSIPVSFSANPDWNFKFRLRKSISIPATSYKSVDKLLVLSDIEGEFEAFRALMIANKVMDVNYNWIFGKAHVVICGDLFDRGRDVIPYLWLLYRLEADAIEKGGFLHVLLGNHDVMNMAGDLRYLASKYPASAQLFGVAYGDLIGERTEIGKWLRSKNAVEKIGNRLFLHAGISPEINAADLTLAELNKRCRAFYGMSTKQLNDEGTLLMSSKGPFWFRGYFGENNVAVSTVDSTLKKFGAKQIFVGHTITKQNIAAYYNFKVIGVDVDQHRGNRKAALFIGDAGFVVDDKNLREPIKLAQ